MAINLTVVQIRLIRPQRRYRGEMMAFPLRIRASIVVPVLFILSATCFLSLQFDRLNHSKIDNK